MNDIASNLRQNFYEFGFSVNERIDALKSLYAEIFSRRDEIAEALKADYNKNSFDAYATEIGIVLNEIRHTVRSLKKWARPKKAHLSIINFPARGRVYAEPFGVVLIIAPWNYPFQLSMCPVIGAVAAGNYVALKPSSKTKNTYAVIKNIIDTVFCGGKVTVTDSRDVLSLRWDYIFFTGSAAFGKTVMKSAAENLTPVTLEMGGKSPCIIDNTADIARAAKRIAWGKFINAGQTCIAPDYLLVHEDIKDKFIPAFINEIKKQYYNGGSLSDGFTHLISAGKAVEVQELIKDAKILFGGNTEGRIMEPTVIEADFNSPIMREEIFAPVAPVIEFSSLDAIINIIRSKEKPLALYYFGKNFDKVNIISYGGGCHNDVLMHVSEKNLPFGGVGNSGLGSYHGKKSFDTFTHFKSVLVKGKNELNTRYAPHGEKKERFLKRFFH